MRINYLLLAIAASFALSICLHQPAAAQHNREGHEKPTKTAVTVPLRHSELLTTSPDFTVSANGLSLFTERVGDGGMEDLNVTNFECLGKQTITISASAEITSYKIKPASSGITGTVNGHELTFTIDGPQKLYIEVNGLPHLAIFANAIQHRVPDKHDQGVVYYEPGVYNPGTIELKNNETIYIEDGAVVNANIRGNHLKNVKIMGRGILNGNISISSSANIEVSGIFIRNTSGWSNTLTDCHHTVYDNVKVFSYKTVWGIDGIDPVSCKSFVINDCFIRTRDDCVSIKSETGGAKDMDISTDSITVTNCLLVGWQHADGVTLGFELQGGTVQNILVKNCDILRARGQGRTGGHSALSIVCDGPSEVRNIRYEDIRVEDDIEYKNLELIVTEGRRYGTAGPGNIRGVYFKNIHWSNANKPFVIAGIPTNLVSDVTFDHCYMAGKLMESTADADFQTEFCKNIKFVTGK